MHRIPDDRRILRFQKHPQMPLRMPRHMHDLNLPISQPHRLTPIQRPIHHQLFPRPASPLNKRRPLRRIHPDPMPVKMRIAADVRESLGRFNLLAIERAAKKLRLRRSRLHRVNPADMIQVRMRQKHVGQLPRINPIFAK